MADNPADWWNKYAKQISTKRVGTKEKRINYYGATDGSCANRKVQEV